jgi:hypothetical protein
MTEIFKENTKKDDFALFEDLERRFGPAMAQQIMDELKKAEKPKKVASGIDYMGAKTLSEASEMYRRDAQTALRRYKIWKGGCGLAMKDVVDMEGVFLKKEFQRSFDFYRRFNKGFFKVYRQAMETYKTGSYVPYKTKKVRLNEVWENTTMLMAA